MFSKKLASLCESNQYSRASGQTAPRPRVPHGIADSTWADGSATHMLHMSVIGCPETSMLLGVRTMKQHIAPHTLIWIAGIVAILACSLLLFIDLPHGIAELALSSPAASPIVIGPVVLDNPPLLAFEALLAIGLVCLPVAGIIRLNRRDKGQAPKRSVLRIFATVTSSCLVFLVARRGHASSWSIERFCWSERATFTTCRLIPLPPSISGTTLRTTATTLSRTVTTPSSGTAGSPSYRFPTLQAMGRITPTGDMLKPHSFAAGAAWLNTLMGRARHASAQPCVPACLRACVLKIAETVTKRLSTSSS